jgi:hydrogenase maturation protease
MLTVIGIGNTLRGDDGIGPVIISELKKENYPDSIRLLDIGSDTFSIIEHLTFEQPVLIIDCAQMGKEPGEIIKIELKEENLSILDKAISLHGFGFSEVYRIAKKLNNNVYCTIIGVQPKSLEFNTDLSKEVRNKIPSIKKMVIREIKKNAKKNNNN